MYDLYYLQTPVVKCAALSVDDRVVAKHALKGSILFDHKYLEILSSMFDLSAEDAKSFNAHS